MKGNIELAFKYGPINSCTARNKETGFSKWRLIRWSLGVATEQDDGSDSATISLPRKEKKCNIIII